MRAPGALRFADYIKMLPSAWVFEHFMLNSDAPRKILSSSMIEETVREFVGRDTLIGHFEQLDTDLRVICACTYLLGTSGFPAQDFRGLDDPFVKSFLVYAAKGRAGGPRYFGFDEFEPLLRSALAQTLVDVASATEHDHPIHADGATRCLNDVVMIAGLGSQGQLKKKRAGGLTRTAAAMVKKLIHDQESGDFAVHLLLHYCIEHGILFETETEYRFNTTGFDRWIGMPQLARYRHLLDFSIHYSGGWREELFREVLSLAHDRWMSLEAFPEPCRNALLNLLRACRFTGLIDIRRSGSDTFFAGVAETIEETREPASGAVRVLPDFSAVINQECQTEELYRYFQVGTLSSFDRVYRGILDRTVLADSLSRGCEGDEIISWLAAWQAPENVIETVREWIREISRLYISYNAMLVVSDEKVTFQVGSYQPLSEYIEPLKAHSVFKIKPGSEQKVREILQSLGFDYRMPHSELEAPSPVQDKEDLLAPDEWVPLVEQSGGTAGSPIASPPPPMRGTKYGAELKALELSEIVHVIDYAILTAQQIIIDYEGSPYVKQNIYTVLPLACQKGIDPVVDAELPRTHSRKQFYIRKIRKIGVLPR